MTEHQATALAPGKMIACGVVAAETAAFCKPSHELAAEERPSANQMRALASYGMGRAKRAKKQA